MVYAPNEVKHFMKLYHKVLGIERDPKELAFYSGDETDVAILHEKASNMPVELRDDEYNRVLGIMDEAIKLRIERG